MKKSRISVLVLLLSCFLSGHLFGQRVIEPEPDAIQKHLKKGDLVWIYTKDGSYLQLRITDISSDAIIGDKLAGGTKRPGRHQQILFDEIVEIKRSIERRQSNPFQAAPPCLKPSPPPTCGIFFITELGNSYRVNSFNSLLPERRNYFTSELGLMKNFIRPYALGITLFLGLHTDNGVDLGDFRFGPKIRFRRWLNPAVSIDISAGLLQRSWERFQKPDFTSSVSLNIEDFVILTTQLEIISRRSLFGDEKITDVPIYIGLKTGSYPGLVLNAAIVGVAAIVGLVFLGAYIAAGPGD